LTISEERVFRFILFMRMPEEAKGFSRFILASWEFLAEELPDPGVGLDPSAMYCSTVGMSADSTS
jgi:hypothetical protein